MIHDLSKDLLQRGKTGTCTVIQNFKDKGFIINLNFQ